MKLELEKDQEIRTQAPLISSFKSHPSSFSSISIFRTIKWPWLNVGVCYFVIIILVVFAWVLDR